MKSIAVPVGRLAPDVDLPGLDGRRRNLAAARGRKIVLVFYRGHW